MLIKDANKSRIEEMIKAAEGKATARTITYKDIVDSIEILEEKLNIPKKHMEGISASIDYNAQTFPRAYKYTPSSTCFEVVRKKSGWDLMYVERSRCRNEEQAFDVVLTEKAKEEILKKHMHFGTGRLIVRF